jgi:hypothetical protein
MTRQILACVGSSLLTVALLGLMGFGPLNPPAGPITPTGVSLDQLAGVVGSITPGGTTLPGRTLTGGAGTVTIVYSDRTLELPIIGYGLTKQSNTSATLSIALEAGLYGGHLDTNLATPLITIHGSDGTTLGPVMSSRTQRNIVNGPASGGNKAVDVLYFTTPALVPMSDGGGTGAF